MYFFDRILNNLIIEIYGLNNGNIFVVRVIVRVYGEIINFDRKWVLVPISSLLIFSLRNKDSSL